MDGDRDDWVSKSGGHASGLDNLTDEEIALRSQRRQELMSE
jgi:hypothetical protein